MPRVRPAAVKSIIPTNHFQPSLPRLPIPDLNTTCRKYLDSVKALTTPQEFGETTRLVEAFQIGVGKELQESLIKFDKSHPETSYFSNDWFDKYLEQRSPLPINTNPFLSVRDDPNKKTPWERAASIIYAAIEFKKQFENNTANPEIYHTKDLSKSKWYQRLIALTPSSLSYYVGYAAGAYALDMSQYSHLFNTTRIPGAHTDTLRQNKANTKVVVFYRGHIFEVETVEDGKPVAPSDLSATLKQIVDSTIEKGPGVGVLTSWDRVSWSRARASLEKNEANKSILKRIDDALFAVVLDEVDSSVLDNEAADPMSKVQSSRVFLHGTDGADRWFDKSLSLHFSTTGTYALNFEHSWGDGVAVLRFVKDTFDVGLSIDIDTAIGKPRRAVRLDFALDAEAVANISQARADFAKLRDSMSMGIGSRRGCGKDYFKTLGIKFDPFFQVCTGLTYYTLHWQIASQYESASTAGFKGGRTECIRGNTDELKQFAEAFARKADSKTLYDLMAMAQMKHAKLTLDAMVGKGVERHLYGLQMQAKRNGLSVNPLYTDLAYKRLKEDMLSTSCIADDRMTMGGFGPVSPGYGIGYGAGSQYATLVVTSFKQSCEGFINEFWKNFEQMVEIHKAHAKAPKTQ